MQWQRYRAVNTNHGTNARLQLRTFSSGLSVRDIFRMAVVFWVYAL